VPTPIRTPIRTSIRTARAVPRVAALCAAAAALVLPALASAHAGRLPGRDAPAPLLYVAERGASSVAAYPPDASGPVAPALRIAGPHTGLRDPWAVAFDPRGDLYAQNYLAESATVVFTPGVAGDVAPLRTVRGLERDAPSLAVDAAGFVYVARFQAPQIEVFAPGASGQGQPARTLQVDGFPRSLAVDSQGNLLVAVVGRPTGAGGNAIEAFAPGASGSAVPLRRIAGPHTGLGTGQGFGGFTGDTVVLTASPLTGRLYAAVSGCVAPTVPPHIAVFPQDGDGDRAPVRTIQGAATGLGVAGQPAAISGIADDQRRGDIYALTSPCTVNGGVVNAAGRVNVYARLAAGDRAPLRSFTDAQTGFTDVQAIAFAPR